MNEHLKSRNQISNSNQIQTTSNYSSTDLRIKIRTQRNFVKPAGRSNQEVVSIPNSTSSDYIEESNSKKSVSFIVLNRLIVDMFYCVRQICLKLTLNEHSLTVQQMSRYQLNQRMVW